MRKHQHKMSKRKKGIYCHTDSDDDENDEDYLEEATVATEAWEENCTGNKKKCSKKSKKAKAAITMPSFTSSSTPEQKSSLFNQLLNIHIPKCSVCSTSWFCDDAHKKGHDFRQQNINHYIKTRAKDFIPFPRCECTTTLMKNPIGGKLESMLDDRIRMQQKKKERNANHETKKEYDFILDILLHETNLSQNDIQIFPHKGMCRPCLSKFIESSNDVLIHDYRDTNQPNVSFSTSKNCPNCRKKFSPKTLSALQAYQPSSSSSSPKHQISSNKQGNTNQTWYDSIVSTIQFVKLMKRLKRALIHRELVKGGIMASSNDDYSHPHESTHTSNQIRDNNIKSILNSSKELMQEWIEEEVSSDDYFSCSDGEEDKDEKIDCNNRSANKQSCCKTSGRATLKRKYHLELNQGELKEELLKKDPIFRQEHEDRLFVLEMIEVERKAIKEGRNQRPGNEQLKRDGALAKSLEEQSRGKGNAPEEKHPSIKKYLSVNDDSSSSSRARTLSSIQQTKDSNVRPLHHDQQLRSDEKLAQKLFHEINRKYTREKKSPMLRFLKHADAKSNKKQARREAIQVQESKTTVKTSSDQQSLDHDSRRRTISPIYHSRQPIHIDDSDDEVQNICNDTKSPETSLPIESRMLTIPQQNIKSACAAEAMTQSVSDTVKNNEKSMVQYISQMSNEVTLSVDTSKVEQEMDVIALSSCRNENHKHNSTNMAKCSFSANETVDLSGDD